MSTFDYKTPGTYVEEIATLPPSVTGLSTAVPAFIGYTEKKMGQVYSHQFKVSSGTGTGATKTFTLTQAPISGLVAADFKVKGISNVNQAASYNAANMQITVNTTGKQADDLFTVSYLVPKPIKIDTFFQYRELFGGPAPMNIETTVSEIANPPAEGWKKQYELTDIDELNSKLNYLLYYSMQLYFSNGGGSCYVVSVGAYPSGGAPVDTDLQLGLDALKAADEPTLILLTDAAKITDTSKYYALCQDALSQAAELKDRFALFDVLYSTNVPVGSGIIDTNAEAFRTGIGINDLDYGAAYYPYLQTALGFTYDESRVTIDGTNVQSYTHTITDAIKVTAVALSTDTNSPSLTISAAGNDGITFAVTDNALTISGVGTSGVTPDALVNAWKAFRGNKGHFSIEKDGAGSAMVSALAATNLTAAANLSLDSLEKTKTGLYNQIKTALAKQHVVLPPSAAIAGIYAAVDRDRGVWKAPANVSLSSVIAPTIDINNEDQESLNVDENGKSINAIRHFNGKGNLVWGARTLDGSSNEWRYVSVRRLFIMVEESVRKASEFAVFEPNDVNTWMKVKSMIESFLFSLWKKGALAGPKPESAYFVNVGLGKSMTPQDVLEGRMIVEIGMAAVRPAEFIILRFSHKLQEA